MKKTILLMTAVMMLSTGCATITQGTSQMLMFNLDPKETRCSLMRVGDGEIGSISYTHNTLTVNKDKDDIIVKCTAPGYAQKTMKIVSAASGGGVASVFLIDLGITDLATGAFWKYPDSLSIVLDKETSDRVPTFDDGKAAYNKGDYAQAIKIWGPLATQGNADSQNNLGVMYVMGIGVTKDDQEALKWFRLAAAQGTEPAKEALKRPEMVEAAKLGQ